MYKAILLYWWYEYIMFGSIVAVFDNGVKKYSSAILILH